MIKTTISIVSPGNMGSAVACARQFAPLLSRPAKKAIYVDCNALSLRTVKIEGFLFTGALDYFCAGGTLVENMSRSNFH
jgi:hypothetical protein